jgi:tRNA/rRNA methyltransferase
MNNQFTRWQSPNHVFILVEPSHAGNIGSAARALAVMGLSNLRVVSPRQIDFAEHPEAIAFASGATQLLAQVQCFSSLDAALADTHLAIAVSAAGREFTATPVKPKVAVRGALGQAPTERVAWVFGTERTGLSIEQAQRCQWLCSIESNPQYGSLNLAQAVQVMAYELRQGLLQDHPATEPVQSQSRRGFANLAQIEGLMQHLETTLVDIGYLDPAQPKRLMPRLRRLFARTRLEQEEIDILRGILKSVRHQQKP